MCKTLSPTISNAGQFVAYLLSKYTKILNVGSRKSDLRSFVFRNFICCMQLIVYLLCICSPRRIKLNVVCSAKP